MIERIKDFIFNEYMFSAFFGIFVCFSSIWTMRFSFEIGFLAFLISYFGLAIIIKLIGLDNKR